MVRHRGENISTHILIGHKICHKIHQKYEIFHSKHFSALGQARGQVIKIFEKTKNVLPKTCRIRWTTTVDLRRVGFVFNQRNKQLQLQCEPWSGKSVDLLNCKLPTNFIFVIIFQFNWCSASNSLLWFQFGCNFIAF